MLAFGLFAAGTGLSLITARAVITEYEISYRFGVRRRRLARSDIQSVDVDPGSGTLYELITLQVRCRGRKRPLKLTALQRPNTSKARAAMEHEAQRIREVLRL